METGVYRAYLTLLKNAGTLYNNGTDPYEKIDTSSYIFFLSTVEIRDDTQACPSLEP